MFDGQILIGGSSGPTLYSPWFSRRGDYLIATLQVISKSTNGSLDTIKVQVATKKREATGSGNIVAGDITIEGNNATLTESATWGPSVLEELVRFKFTVNSESEWWIFRMLDSVWYDAVGA